MPKFSSAEVAAPSAPVQSIGVTGQTHEGGVGYGRDAKSELFLLAATNMVGEQTFYESAGDRDSRFADLVAQVTAEDPGWVARFVPYLREVMLLRSASVVMAAEYVAAVGPGGRDVVSSALKRADEPAEMLGYWLSTRGRSIPKPIKRGVADAAQRLYSERAALRYDGQSRGVRMADVLELTHPSPRDQRQSALFRYLLDARHDRDDLQLNALPLIRDAIAWERGGGRGPIPEGVPWERASSLRSMTASDWEELIPSMGYMALLRNLRNFDQAGISQASAHLVETRLADPLEVEGSRQLPLRFLSALKAVQSVRYLPALEDAVGHSLRNVPVLKGRTLIMADDSASMDDPLSERSQLRRRDAASLFAAAIALRAESADLVAYANDARRIPVPLGGSVLLLAKRVAAATTGGTRTIDLLAALYDRHDRVIILTDEQAFGTGHVSDWWGGNSAEIVNAIPCPIYTFNLAGYGRGHLPSGRAKRYAFGGLTDAGFRMLSILESRKSAQWPF